MNLKILSKEEKGFLFFSGFWEGGADDWVILSYNFSKRELVVDKWILYDFGEEGGQWGIIRKNYMANRRRDINERRVKKMGGERRATEIHHITRRKDQRRV